MRLGYFARIPDARVYLVDEIGKMECLSDRFIAAVRVLLAAHAPGWSPLSARMEEASLRRSSARPECELWEVTRVNRDELPARILAWLAERS